MIIKAPVANDRMAPVATAAREPSPLAFSRFDPSGATLPDDDCRLGPFDVDVWPFSLAVPHADVDAWERELDDEERRSAVRFRMRFDRNAYIVAHAVLRRVLGRYTGVAPRELRFGRAPGGKPLLAGVGSGTLQFNLAHCSGAALIAVTRVAEVGVDIEAARDNVDPLSIATRFFTDAEHQAIFRAEDRNTAFFRHWVAKEAVVKAVGAGLASPLDAFVVQFEASGDHASVRWIAPCSGHDISRVHLLPTPPGWHAALALRSALKGRIRILTPRRGDGASFESL